MAQTTISPQVFWLAQIISALPDTYQAETTNQARLDCLKVLSDLDMAVPHTLDQSTIMTLLVHNKINARGCRYVWNWYLNRLRVIRTPDESGETGDDSPHSFSKTS